MTHPVESAEIHLAEPVDIIRARSEARRLAGLMGFGLADQTRLATSVSELARNVLQYAGKGVCLIRDTSSDAEISIHISFEDNGPGIPHIDQAMRDGYSTSGGLGVGLPGTQRLMDYFNIESRPGMTRVEVAMARRRT